MLWRCTRIVQQCMKPKNTSDTTVLCCRFDLMHVMIDDPDDIMDYRIASHIVAVHQRQDQAFDVPYTMADIQLYLKYARAHKPELTAAVSHPGLPQCLARCQHPAISPGISRRWVQKLADALLSRCVCSGVTGCSCRTRHQALLYTWLSAEQRVCCLRRLAVRPYDVTCLCALLQPSLVSVTVEGAQ